MPFDLVPFTFRASKGMNFPWQNNYCLRVFDMGLISHFPCSFHCEKSKEIAEKNLGFLESYDPDIASYFRSALPTGVIYAEGVGVYALKNIKVEENMLKYSPSEVIPTQKNDFYHLLKSRDKIIPINKNQFIIDNVAVKDDQTFLALFS